MAKQVIKAAYVAINSSDLSAYCSKIELSIEAEDQETTTFGSAGWKEVLGGLNSGELALTFKQDVAAAALDSILWPLFGTVVTFEVRISSTAVGTSNPKYTGSVLIAEHAPISGSVGDVAEMDVSYPTSGAITRATA
jgi:hypothetical protein